MIDTSKQVKEITYNGTPLVLYQEPQEKPVLQSKTVDIIANGTYTTTPDEGYDGLSSVAVTVNVPSSGGADTDGLLSKYGVVAEYGYNLAANNYAGITVASKRLGNSGGYYYIFGLIDSSVPVGGNILDYVKVQRSNNSYVYHMAVCYNSSSLDVSEITMDKIRASNIYNIRKYTNVTYSAGTFGYGSLIMFDDNGKCLFNGTMADGFEALNNKTIDISNGIYLTASKIENTSKTTTTNHSFVFK